MLGVPGWGSTSLVGFTQAMGDAPFGYALSPCCQQLATAGLPLQPRRRLRCTICRVARGVQFKFCPLHYTFLGGSCWG